ncbi:A disintegrin and metalloproteinase with thrombospondin motifs 18-like [Mizuhopecten yessoensis]|uniref:A disintegrin and metalloproteinase with thrombospondin motifs 18-like n=1 Tax=Mizuhopecten yessoensis TaxID=6573 RepID=UPI000B45EE5F|nr:A disintegrin and metalloproteinase with thrombospondin motifs 18-like [Mizuhopecten yessoensis]
MELRRRVSDTDTKTRQRKPRKRINISSTQYQMGLIVIIDFSIYQTWYRRSDEATAVERDIDAKSKIRQYMAHVINGTPGASPWTSRRFIAQPRDLVYADDALNELIKWRYRMGHELPIHDHTILFTGYDLYRPTLANKGVAGFARVRSMCSHSSVSVVEEHGGFGSILTATHEIGHSLGAYHDGHNNSCAGEDNFIMTPIGGSATPSNALNPFHFSECSEDAFDNLIDALPRSHCLTDETDTYDQEEFESYLTQKAGQLYGPNQQCRQHLGSESYYAWGGILGEATEVCTHMACKNAMSNTSFNIYYAAQGTSCGNKKWCVDGECLYEEKAPKREETCVHGDAWRRFGGLTCAQYVNADPSRCYYSYYSRFCCVSCASLRKGEPGCEYGNRKKKVCNMVDRDPRFCYHDNNENLCCGSCKKHNTGITDYLNVIQQSVMTTLTPNNAARRAASINVNQSL